MTSTGAWCWFSEPRVLYDSARNRTYSGWVSPTGDIMAKQVNHDTGVEIVVTLHQALNVDDHANPSFAKTPDGRIQIFYAHHSASDILHRWTGPDGNLTVLAPAAWMGLPSKTFHVSGSTYSYASPVYVPAANRFIVFSRQNMPNNQQRWVVMSNEDGLATETWAGYPLWAASTVSGPYLKAMCNGVDTVDLVFTTGHPFEIVCDVYYARFRIVGGVARYENAAGVQITSVPFSPAQATLVQAGAPVGNTWIWQVDRDASNAPVVLMSTYPGNLYTEHKYRFARWNGTSFVSSEICSAGGPLVTSDPPSRYYSGGICFDGNDRSKVYLSRQDADGWHLERWGTADNGATWAFESVIDAPVSDGGKYVRPFSPHGYAGAAPEVLCFKGSYTTYLNYAATLMAYTGDYTPPPTPESDLVAACETVEADASVSASVKDMAAKLKVLFAH